MTTQLTVTERSKGCICLCAVWHRSEDLCEGTAARRIRLKTGISIVTCRPCGDVINRVQKAA